MEDENERENRIGNIMLTRTMFTKDMHDDLKINFENSKLYKNEENSTQINSQSLVAAYAMKQLSKG